MMVNAYQTLKKSNEKVVTKISELEAANQKLEEMSADKSEEGIKDLKKKHKEALKKIEMESKGALDGARARERQRSRVTKRDCRKQKRKNWKTSEGYRRLTV